MRGKILFISSVTLLFLTIQHPALADVSIQLKQAETYQNNRQYEQAEAIYQQIVTAFPDTNDALVAQKQLTLIYIATDRQQEADAAFEKLIADFSEHKGISGAVWQIAKRYNTSKKYDKALELYQYNVEHFPKDIHAMWSQMNIIRSYISDGNEPAADAAFNKLLAIFSGQPKLPNEVHRLAELYDRTGRYNKANGLYQKALQLYQYVIDSHPDSNDLMWAKAGAARSNIAIGNEAAAEAVVNELIADFNDNPELPTAIFMLGEEYYNKAFQYQNQGQETEAKEHFRKAIAIWERIINELRVCNMTPQAYYFAGRCYEKLGQVRPALERYQVVVENWPDYERAWNAQFLIGCCLEGLTRGGQIPLSEGAKQIRDAFGKVLQNYPDCLAAGAAEAKMKRWEYIE